MQYSHPVEQLRGLWGAAKDNKAERRRAGRFVLETPATLHFSGKATPVSVRDASAAGVFVACEAGPASLPSEGGEAVLRVGEKKHCLEVQLQLCWKGLHPKYNCKGAAFKVINTSGESKKAPWLEPPVARPEQWYSPDQWQRVLSSPWYRAVFELEATLSATTYEWFGARNFRTIFAPLTTGAISSPMGRGSDSKPLRATICAKDTYLADSMQFMLEYAVRLGAANSFYLMPSFRGDAPDKTHLCQFYHSEAEIFGGLDDVISTVEGYLTELSAALIRRHGALIESVAGSTRRLASLAERKQPLPRVTFDEAAKRLSDLPGAIRQHEGWRTMSRQGELRLAEEFGGAVWLTHFDHLSVPFYQAFAADESKALAADLLLAGVGEVVGSGERHETGEQLRRALELHEVSPDSYGWYIGMKEAFPVRTGGFGLGVERYLCWALEHDDIRHFQIIPRINGENHDF